MSTVFVTLCDITQFDRAKGTISQLYHRGNWRGNIVIITVNFTPDDSFIEEYSVMIYPVQHINTDYIVQEIKKYPFYEPNDKRQLNKLIQWDKLYVFSSYFKQWDRVIFLDAGIHVFNDVQLFVDLDCTNSILASDDSDPYDNGVRFHRQIDLSMNTNVVIDFINTFGVDCLTKKYFLNCMFMFDTQLIEENTFNELIEMMNRFPICRCNEMTLMNMYFTLQKNVWKPFPMITGDKLTFTFCETNYNNTPHCSNFIFLKYPVTGC